MAFRCAHATQAHIRHRPRVLPAKQRHAAALFKMLALSERYEAARTLEAELLVEASAAREVDRMRTMQRAANLEQLNSGKFEIIDVRYH